MSSTNKQFTCERCVMDRSAEEIVFTKTGCNFCDLAMKMKPRLPSIVVRSICNTVPIEKTGNKYDVLLGLSGGVDSSMCLHHLVKAGIKPLCFSIDNGWNDPKADENIMRLVEGMKVPFFRYTIDLDRFKELQGAFLMSGTKNVEIPTDHILMSASYEMASKYGIKTIISGGNWETENIMPISWGYQARDLVHIKAIYKKFFHKKLKGLPTCSLLKFNWYKWVKRIKTINLLDYYKYNREESIKLLGKEYGYKRTGEKHCESIWTWWFQNYYLFEKFGIDKRKAHLSSLILSKQITRDEALAELEKNPVYPKIGIEERVMKYPKHSYKDYPTDEKLFNFISKIIKACRF